jgi:hypothetical protein
MVSGGAVPTSEKTAPWLEITQQWFDDAPSWEISQRSGDFLAMCNDVVNMEGQMILFRSFPIYLFPPGKAGTWSLRCPFGKEEGLSACLPFTIYLLDPIGYSTGQAASFWITQWKWIWLDFRNTHETRLETMCLGRHFKNNQPPKITVQ